MELRHLRYLVAVAEDLSFRRAAERLHVSHAALSQQIGDLEDELGLKLFDRNSHRVELTEAGRAFLSGARRTLTAAKYAIIEAKEAAQGEMSDAKLFANRSALFANDAESAMIACSLL